MSALADRVAGTFRDGGALANGWPGLQSRAGQTEMAQAVTVAIEGGGVLVAEAGTGVGKTLAYLVPLLLSGVRAVVSTSSHLLQAQLAQRDIPALCDALGIPVQTAVLKGRAHYLCNLQLEQALRSIEGSKVADPRERADLFAIRQWAMQTRSGDFAELPGGLAGGPWRSRLGSTSESCLQADCSHFTACHVRQARTRADSADWLIVNHHLYFAEFLAGRDHQKHWLAGRGAVVFDEAHRLIELSRDFLGRVVGEQRLMHIAQDLALQGPLEARGMQPWAHLAMKLRQAVEVVRAALINRLPQSLRMRWIDHSPQGIPASQWMPMAAAVGDALNAIREALGETASASRSLDQLQRRVVAAQQDWVDLLRGPDASPEPSAQWLAWEGDPATGSRWALVRAPVALADGLARWMQDPKNAGCSWIFTSATLGSDAALGWFTHQMGFPGLRGLQTVRFGSPFHQSGQMSVYVPLDLPEPSDAAHSLALADRVAEWAQTLDGRAMVLTTTVKAARRIAHRLRWRLDQPGQDSLLVLDESQATRDRLLAVFRQVATSQAQALRMGVAPPCGAVLVASMAFWEGVDLPGDLLQLLVIDKLPFPPPDDPMVQARALVQKRQGLDAFEHTHLADAELALRQGAGRLIRSGSDTGVLVVGDRRLGLKSYGQRLQQALPPHRRLVDAAELAAELRRLRLTRASTRDRLPS